MKSKIFFLICGFALCGCASLADKSEGKVGCPTNEMVISDVSDKNPFTVHQSWVVTCRGQRFYCSTQMTGEYSEQTSCAPEVKSKH